MSEGIRLIKGFETLPLRQRVLKPFASEVECAYPEDDFASTFHFGFFHLEKLISIATVLQQSHSDFPAHLSYRLRGMAVDPEYQGQGYGQRVLKDGMDYLEKQNCDFLWFNARVKAFTFYGKMGFATYGPLFELPQIGLHKVMYKNLNPR